MVVRESGRFVGSVSGGCVEADVVERAKQIFAGEDARRVHYGVSDGEALEVGLSCGGEIDVWLEQADPELWRDVRALLDEDGYGMLYTNTATGEKRLERGVLESTGPARRRHLRRGGRGPAARDDLRRRRGRRAPLRLRQAARLADDRRRRAARARDAASGCRAPARSIKAWPDEVVDRIDERTVVVTLSHEERLDIPAVAAALERNARYVGAIGAKRTQERRRAALAEQGFSEADLDRIHGPAGPRPRRPLAGAGRARDRGRDRRRDLGRPQGGTRPPPRRRP